MEEAISKHCILFLLLLLATLSPSFNTSASAKTIKRTEPCNRFVLYYHDIIFGGNNTRANATSAAVTKGSGPVEFGRVVVFDDPMTVGESLDSGTVARAQGMYFYDMKAIPNAWFSFSLVFNSTQRKGTLNIIGDDIITAKMRDLSVVGGTGDFFMARGMVTLTTESLEGLTYFRLKMDVKLYECY